MSKSDPPRPLPQADQTLKWLLGIIGVAVVFALGRWSAGGDRLDQIEANQRQLEQQLSSLRGAAPPSNVPTPTPRDPNANSSGLRTGIDLVVDGRPSIGRVDAPVTFIEFSDFQCPFCGRYVRETLPRIRADYVDTGKVRYVFRHFPIASLHPQAPDSARAAECAHAQGKFWPMHDRLFADPQKHTVERLAAIAQSAGVSPQAYSACMAAGPRPVVTEDLDAGARGGIGGTPAFFMGTTQADGTVRVTHTVYGAKPYAAFQAEIGAALAAASLR